MNAKSHQKEDEIELDASNADERKTLLWVLGIISYKQFSPGSLELSQLLQVSWVLPSTTWEIALSMPSASMLLGARLWPRRVARLSGVLLIVLGLALLVEVLRRFRGRRPDRPGHDCDSHRKRGNKFALPATAAGASAAWRTHEGIMDFHDQ
jgi:hypothetical protein